MAEADEQGGLGPSPLGDEPPSDVVRSPAPDQLERLAEASHNGWRAARIAQGWADHPISGPYVHLPMGVLCSTCHGDPKMHHPSMVPYSDLPEADKEASRGPVRAVLEAFPPLPPPVYDATVSPAHYHLPDGRQAWEVIEEMLGLRVAIDYHRGAELKYELRAGRKPGSSAAQDRAKAAQHRLRILDLQIALRDGTAAPRPPMPGEG